MTTAPRFSRRRCGGTPPVSMVFSHSLRRVLNGGVRAVGAVGGVVGGQVLRLRPRQHVQDLEKEERGRKKEGEAGGAFVVL